jgi:dihydrolipoamide dehydrogenase
MGASGRATTLDRNDGVTKLLIDPDSEEILGAGIWSGAGELIAEGVLAVEMGAKATDLNYVYILIQPFQRPTESAEAF